MAGNIRTAFQQRIKESREGAMGSMNTAQPRGVVNGQTKTTALPLEAFLLEKSADNIGEVLQMQDQKLAHLEAGQRRIDDYFKSSKTVTDNKLHNLERSAEASLAEHKQLISDTHNTMDRLASVEGTLNRMTAEVADLKDLYAKLSSKLDQEQGAVEVTPRGMQEMMDDSVVNSFQERMDALSQHLMEHNASNEAHDARFTFLEDLIWRQRLAIERLADREPARALLALSQQSQ